MKAKYIQRGDAVDFTPATDMEAGEIVRLGHLIGVTRIPVKAGTLGSLAVTGVFDIHKASGITFSAGDSVFWSQLGTADKTGTLLGIAVAAAESNADTVRVLLNCDLNEETSTGETEAEWLPL